MGILRTYLALGAVLVVGAVMFFRGITWGLPSREKTDRFLFAQRTPWSGEEIRRLAPSAAMGGAGADVDANPNLDRSRPIWLNQTDAQRAEIVRRYRLYTYQPDEMITMMALRRAAAMRGDPQLYQYGGLWIYPVGAILKAASMAGLIELRGDDAFYLDHPEEFGKFYLIARAYSAAWGMLGAVLVFAIARRLLPRAADGGPGSPWVAALAAGCYCTLPVVVTMAHEAKPHLPGAVLILLAVLAADRYVRRGLLRDALLVGVACGAAVGMVLSAVPVVLVVPTMLWLRWRRQSAEAGRTRPIVWARHTMLAAAGAAACYIATNPYVAINAVWHPEILRSNLGNSGAMYSASVAGLGNAMALVRDGAGIAIFAIATVTLVAWGLLRAMSISRRAPQADGLWPLLLVPAGAVFVQFALLAAGKPAEHARFAIFLDIVLVLVALSPLAALAGVASVQRYHRVLAALAMTCVALTTGLIGSRYLTAFVRDTHPTTSRLRYAQRLAERPRAIWLKRDPAPYNCPPVDLWKNQLWLRPEEEARTPETAGPELAGVIALDVADSASETGRAWLSTRIAWANKMFRLTAIPSKQTANPAASVNR